MGRNKAEGAPEGDSRVSIVETILTNIPKEAEVTRVDFEGPRIAIYAKKPEVLVEQSYIIGDIVNLIHKRIVVRSDPAARMSEADTMKRLKKIIPPEANVRNITFDPAAGEVIIEVDKPGLIIGRNSAVLQQIIRTTRWRPLVQKSLAIPSKIMNFVRNCYYYEAEERKRVLRSIGERIFRDPLFKDGEVRITALGGFQQVGRSAVMVQTKESCILLDCGINPGSANPIEAFPRLDLNEFDLDQLEAVIISHAHLDHCGFLPFLYKYGYEGPVYCSEPTLMLMSLLQMDYLEVLSSEGKPLPYDQKSIREQISHVIPLPYGSVIDISPDIKVTLHNAGHILGSAVIHLHIGEGLHNIVYTGDYKFMRTMLLEPTIADFPRVETLITEATYGAAEDVMPLRAEVENELAQAVNQTLSRGGKVLIPVLAVGRAQEIMLVLDKCMHEGKVQEAPIFIEGMISEVTAIHTAYPDYLARSLRNEILYEAVNPFESEYFTTVRSPNQRPAIIEGEPCVIMATSGMLEGGPVLDYFRGLAPDEKNMIVFVSYQIDGTLGRRVQKGLSEVPMMDESGKMEIVKVKAEVRSIEGFSGHSDRNQLFNYVRRLSPRPQRVILCHGERAKCFNMSNMLSRALRMNTLAPANLESIRLR